MGVLLKERFLQHIKTLLVVGEWPFLLSNWLLSFIPFLVLRLKLFYWLLNSWSYLSSTVHLSCAMKIGGTFNRFGDCIPLGSQLGLLWIIISIRVQELISCALKSEWCGLHLSIWLLMLYLYSVFHCTFLLEFIIKLITFLCVLTQDSSIKSHSCWLLVALIVLDVT